MYFIITLGQYLQLANIRTWPNCLLAIVRTWPKFPLGLSLHLANICLAKYPLGQILLGLESQPHPLKMTHSYTNTYTLSH